MKTVGLIYEYNPVVNSLRYSEFKRESNYDKENVLKYLKSGYKIATTMQIVCSLNKGDEEIIGGIVYLTDGMWIWANYLTYYVEKESIELPDAFLEHISNSSDVKLKLSSIKIQEATLFLKNNII